MKREEVFQGLLDKVMSISIDRVIGNYVPLERRGSYYMAICPFHDDRNLGSFVVTPGLNIFKCFACGEGGNAITFVRKLYSLSFVDATIKIGQDLGLLSTEELDALEKVRVDPEVVRNLNKKVFESIGKKNEEEIAPVEHRDKIYRMFLRELSLGEEDKKELMEKRKLKEESIEKGLYRTLKKDLDVTEKMMKKNKLHDKDLVGVPGFYKKRDGEILSWSHMTNEGLIIPLINAQGLIYSLQVRKKEGSSRYTFFTSSFAKNKSNLFQGTSAKAGVDVVYPSCIKNSTLFLTEGRFKGATLANFLDSVVFTLQGVSSFNKKLLKEEIYFAEKKMKGKFSRVIVCYDADMESNSAVKAQARKLKRLLNEICPYEVYFMVWDEEKGKGIDDLIIGQEYEKKEDICPDIEIVEKI